MNGGLGGWNVIVAGLLVCACSEVSGPGVTAPESDAFGDSVGSDGVEGDGVGGAELPGLPGTDCAHRPDGEACSMGCFEAASCQGGQCVGEASSATVCPASVDPCVVEWRCAAASGECSEAVFAAAGAGCDVDGDVCTLDRCDGAGVCAATGEVDACAAEAADAPCYSWQCDASAGCVQTFAHVGASCDDGSPCTVNDTCTEGLTGQLGCFGSPVDIDDDNACTDDSCVDGTGIHKPLTGTACEVTCAHGGAVAGQCEAGACQAAEACAECATTADCPQPADLCLPRYACARGQCVPEATGVDCPASAVACLQSVCDPGTGECVAVPTAGGEACDDGDACTNGETCAAGACGGGAAVPCEDGLFCNGSATCDPALGCLPAIPPVLSDGIDCTVDTCSEAMGGQVVHTPSAAACSDGNACNGDEACHPTDGCVAGVPLSSDDGIPCTVDACDPLTGTIVHLPLNSACDDGNPCNGLESCHASGCVGGIPKPVDDGVACTIDHCDPATGAVSHTPSHAACDDENPCNGAETCHPVDGCLAGSPVAQPFQSVVAYWPLNAAALDHSGNGRHGIVHGQPTATDGPFGDRPALRFDGVDDHIATPQPVVATADNALTLSAWVRFTDTCAPAVCGRPILGGDSLGLSWEHRDGVGQLAFGLRDAASQGCAVWSGPGFNDGEWHHVVGTWDHGAVAFYVDGSLTGSNVCPPLTDASPISLGKLTGGSTPEAHFQGDLADVALLDEALDEQAVAAWSAAACPLAPLLVEDCGEAEPGQACDDGDACTLADVCADDTCVGIPVACPDDANPCTTDVCDPANGLCGLPVTDGTPVPDANVCDGAESCAAGVVAPGVPLTCEPPGAPCSWAVCDPLAGGCVTQTGPSAGFTEVLQLPIAEPWTVLDGYGDTSVTEVDGQVVVTAQPLSNPGSSFGFQGDPVIGAAHTHRVQMHHAGSGRTSVFVETDVGTLRADLDTDDTAYLALTYVRSDGTVVLATEWKHSSAPYLDTWIDLTITTSGEVGRFIVDGVVLETVDLGAQPGSSHLTVRVGSISWKSGPNVTTFGELSSMAWCAVAGCDDAPDGSLCDDGDGCTHADACLFGACQGEPVVCPSDGSPCTLDVCDPPSGTCGVLDTSATLSVTLQPGAEGHDQYIGSVYNSDPAGTSETIRAGGWGDHYWTLLRFDLGGLPEGATAAQVGLFAFNTHQPTSMYLDRVTSAWEEGISWASRPSTVELGSIPAAVEGTWYGIDVTPQFNGWAGGDLPNWGIQLRSHGTWNNYNEFRSSDYPEASLRPKLTASYQCSYETQCLGLADGAGCDAGDGAAGSCLGQVCVAP